jgi:nucleobase:cation symporter-1, NCS1 family
MTSSIKDALRHLEVKHNGEPFSDELYTRWGNRDIFPVPLEQRRFTIVSYFSFWAIASMSVTAWAYGGSLLVLGLSTAEGIGCIIIAAVFVAVFAYLCAHPGASMHLG